MSVGSAVYFEANLGDAGLVTMVVLWLDPRVQYRGIAKSLGRCLLKFWTSV
jgi:hypothetical protein